MTQVHAIHCPTCGAKVPAADVELSLLLAKCLACDEVFSFGDAVGRPDAEAVGRAAGAAPDAAPDRPPIPLDHGVVEREEAGGLILELRWFGLQGVFLLVFALFWNGFLAVWYSIALTALLSGDGEAVMMVVFPLIHVAAGLGIGYWSIATLLNRTTIRVDRHGIAVRHGPLPWPGSREIPVPDVLQLYVEPRVVRGKNTTRTVYDLNAVLRSGSITLVSGIEDARSARFLEHRIEGWLGIVDRPVAGQHLTA